MDDRTRRYSQRGGGDTGTPQDRTEYFDAEQRTEYLGGYQGGNNDTEYLGQHTGHTTEYLGANNTDTQFLGAADRGGSGPRQYMPRENDTRYEPSYTETHYGAEDGYRGYDDYQDYGPQPYDEPYRPEEPKKKRNSSAIALTTMAVLAGLAAIVLFFLWRGAEDRANQPPPPPVTVTVTTSEPGLLDDLFGRGGRDGEGAPQITLPSEVPSELPPLPSELPSELPTDIPREIPPELQDEAEDIAGRLQRFIDDMFGG